MKNKQQQKKQSDKPSGKKAVDPQRVEARGERKAEPKVYGCGCTIADAADELWTE